MSYARARPSNSPVTGSITRRWTAKSRYPFEPSLELRDAPRFYALPQPKLPDKPYPPSIDYNHPSLSI